MDASRCDTHSSQRAPDPRSDGPSVRVPSTSDRRLPRLPPEILNLILHEAFPSLLTSDLTRGTIGPAGAAALPPFHQVRDPQDERNLAATIRQTGHTGRAWFRSLLFNAPHVGTSHRADRLLAALRLALPNDADPDAAASTEGYLKPLVRRLSLDIRPHPLSPKLDREGLYAHADGVTPHRIRQLADALPELESLVISTTQDGGDSWLCGKWTLDALAAFGKSVRELEISGIALGYQNALHVWAEALPHLRHLRLRGLVPGWTVLPIMEGLMQGYLQSKDLPPYLSLRHLEDLVLWDCALNAVDFALLMQSLTPTAANETPPVRHLTLHRLHIRENTTTGSAGETQTRRVPFGPSTLITELRPLVPHLTSLHLVLYDQGPRILYRARGLPPQLPAPAPPPESDPRPGDSLLRDAVGGRIKTLTLGGPYCVSDAGFAGAMDRAAMRVRESSLSATAAGGSSSSAVTPPQHEDPHWLKRLTLLQCAERGGKEGLSPEGFLEALQGGWVRLARLEVIDVSGMEADMESEGALAAAGTGREDARAPARRSLWDKKALERISARVEEINAERRRIVPEQPFSATGASSSSSDATTTAAAPAACNPNPNSYPPRFAHPPPPPPPPPRNRIALLLNPTALRAAELEAEEAEWQRKKDERKARRGAGASRNRRTRTA